MAFLALAFLLIAAPVLADQPAPAPAAQEFVDPATLKARAEALRDAVADLSVSNGSIKTRAHGFFDKLPEERLVVAAGNYRRMDRDRKSTRLNSSHIQKSRMPSSA